LAFAEPKKGDGLAQRGKGFNIAADYLRYEVILGVCNLQAGIPFSLDLRENVSKHSHGRTRPLGEGGGGFPSSCRETEPPLAVIQSVREFGQRFLRRWT
jgi:hypothetical protein